MSLFDEQELPKGMVLEVPREHDSSVSIVREDVIKSICHQLEQVEGYNITIKQLSLNEVGGQPANLQLDILIDKK